MKIFVRQQVRKSFENVRVQPHTLWSAIVARFVVLQSVYLQVIGKREKKIVVAIVPRAVEQRVHLRDQLPHMLQLFVGKRSRSATIRRDIQAVINLLAGSQVVSFKERAGQQGRINQRGQRNSIKLHCAFCTTASRRRLQSRRKL